MSEADAAEPARYHGAAMALHWLIALLLAYQFALGLRLEDKVAPAQAFTAFQQHKSIGIAILLLSLVRLALRFAKPRPPEVGLGPQRFAARLAHGAFYAIMLLGPISGWIIVSTAKLKVPTLLFGLVPWPHLPVGAGLHEPAEIAHAVLGWALPVLFVLHVAAVIHHLRLRDSVPQRMFPAGLAAGAGLSGALAALALAGWLGLAGSIPDLWSRPAGSVPTPAPSASAVADATGSATDPATDEAPEPPEPTATASDATVASEAVKGCDWTLAGGSRLGFATSYAGEAVNGTFRDWSAQIRFCEDDPASGAIAASIGLASADTADATRDENLSGASFFDAASFPRARFTAKGFKALGGGRYAADGMLSLRGKSRPVRLTFSLKVAGDKATAQGTARLSRLAFGIGTDEWAATDQIPDPVSIQFTIQARRKGL